MPGALVFLSLLSPAQSLPRSLLSHLDARLSVYVCVCVCVCVSGREHRSTPALCPVPAHISSPTTQAGPFSRSRDVPNRPRPGPCAARAGSQGWAGSGLSHPLVSLTCSGPPAVPEKALSLHQVPDPRTGTRVFL